jgi:pyridoxine 5'-phosphate synthase PdxJ
MDGEYAGKALAGGYRREPHRQVIEMTEMNYVGTEFVERLLEDFIQRTMNIAILVIRHIDATDEDIRPKLICFVPDDNVTVP